MVIAVEMRESTSSQAGASGAPVASQSADKSVKARSTRTHPASMMIYERWDKLITLHERKTVTDE